LARRTEIGCSRGVARLEAMTAILRFCTGIIATVLKVRLATDGDCNCDAMRKIFQEAVAACDAICDRSTIRAENAPACLFQNMKTAVRRS